MRLADTKAGRIWYKLERKGRPTVLITGLVGYASYWHLQAGNAKHRRVLTYDHLGIGQSDRPSLSFSVEGMAADLVVLRDELGLEKVDMVKYSTSGCIAQIIAANFPKRVGRLICASSWLTCGWRLERFFRLRQAMLRTEGVLGYSRRGALTNYPAEWALESRQTIGAAEHRIACDADANILSARIDAILKFDGTPYASQIHRPTTVVCARDDQVTPLHMSTALAAALPQAKTDWFGARGLCFTQVHARAFKDFISAKLTAVRKTQLEEAV